MPRRPEKLERLVGLLTLLPDRADRIQALIDIADRFRGVPEAVATRPYPTERLVPGCESQAYFWATPNPDGTLKFQFAVENPQGISAMALAVILDETLSGAPPEEVATVAGDLIYEIFGPELSMGKSMGLMGMVAVVTSAARQQLAARVAGGELAQSSRGI
jgi:cysteine desulfuration protein SufE